jgi:ADP-heptose:LPS heptosyltransferase
VIADVGPSPAAPTAILKGSSFIDELIVIDRQPLRRENGALVMDEKVSGIVCDLFIDFAPYGNRGWFKAVIREIILAKKLCARYTIGFHLSAPPINKFTRLVRHGFIQNEPRRAEIILKKLGLTADYDRDLFPADEAEKKAVLGKIAHSGQRHKDFVVMHPGGNMDIQLWATERFAALADKVSEGYGLDIVVTGVKSEADIANKLASSARGKVINLCGETSLQELIEMLRMARACITNDTGTMHVAAMVGTPTLAIFGTRLSPLWWYPVGSKVTALFCFEPCSFCYLDYCGHKNCLQGVNTENVALAFKELLLKNPMPKI